MSLKEVVRPWLLARGISVEALLYQSPGIVEVYIGRWGSVEVVSKVVVLPTGVDEAIILREYNALCALQHPGILKLYDCFWANDQTLYYLVIVTEKCKSDLGKVIKERNGQLWQEAELWEMMKSLVDVLAYMQEQGFAHRDLKPENIFSTETGVKLGDFGSSRLVNGNALQLTLAGSPLFLSPLLKQGYFTNSTTVAHNVYKSDVYSLGVTFLLLSMLKAPLFLMENGAMEVKVVGYIQEFAYSERYQQVLAWMLREEEPSRCDFLELRQYLQSLFTPAQEPELDTVTCLHCSTATEREHLNVVAVVPLLCDPLNHLFCSRKCLQEFIASHPGNEACPICNVEFSEDLLQFAAVGYGEWMRSKASAMLSFFKRKVT